MPIDDPRYATTLKNLHDADLLALHAALDADPADHDTRRVLSDWYHDAGDMVMADGLRWMVAIGVHTSWDSQTVHSFGEAGPPFDRLAGGERFADHRPVAGGAEGVSFVSRRRAEEALCRALAEIEGAE